VFAVGRGEGRTVQHGSTATGTDLEGRGYTLQDGDLRGWTPVDVLPVVCKQGVRGSSPVISTGQKNNSNSRTGCTAVKYSDRDCTKYRTFEPGLLLADGRWPSAQIAGPRAAEQEEFLCACPYWLPRRCTAPSDMANYG
jgi:hypothetical protein